MPCDLGYFFVTNLCSLLFCEELLLFIFKNHNLKTGKRKFQKPTIPTTNDYAVVHSRTNAVLNTANFVTGLFIYLYFGKGMRLYVLQNSSRVYIQ